MTPKRSSRVSRPGLVALIGLAAVMLWAAGAARAADPVPTTLPAAVATSPTAGAIAAEVPASEAPVALSRRGQQRAEMTHAVLDLSALPRGRDANALVAVSIKEGFKAQSRNPTDKFLIPFEVRFDTHPALTVADPLYPKGKRVPFAEPKELDVYVGQVLVRVPIQVKADAPLGPTTVTGTLTYQICDETTCFPPEDVPFKIETSIVAADAAVDPINQVIFREAGLVPVATAAGPAYSLLGGLSLAFAVGVLFNLVPCVLPVLPLKALGFYEVAQHNRGKSITFGLAFSAGVVASFATLGLLVVVLKVFKWGELFSNPYFSAVLAGILVVMALNMFGLFTVNVPTGMYAFSPRHDTYFGNFLFGILTAALSTPCTFGLFVSVLGWALTQPPSIGLLAISTVGAGMASPYVVLSAFPEMARKFPRTGPWAEVMRQFMGFLLLAVAVFFAQEFITRVLSSAAVWWTIFGIIAAGGVFLVARGFKYGKTARAPLVASTIAVLLAGAALWVTLKLTYKPYDWRAYQPAALTDLKARKVVLVEFTATWCANCHTLEALVINSKPVRQDVKRLGVEMVKADLTAKDAPGWQLLRDLKGEGVPLTVIYSPKLDQPIVLTGLYSIDDLRKAIERAATGPVQQQGTAVAQGS